MKMNVAEAKARLSELIAAAERGEEVIIARGGVPVVRLIPVKQRGIRLGLLEGQVPKESLPNFLEPMSEAELAEWGA
ncbi:MAG: type II toxin-antitoxin system prevent-host-death family antitoxin [Rhodobacteraceae bacterium]|nr:type II toxin-antitoxin system prevent-host-death family antitoxin [Paracoccaceae bacterium]MCF8515917.1 type II toxin-antitoxin system prevent-host-death family antitoxin [Paracoccaceae bacterium]MCF8520314.1 type II toxin-antitoxin system prevent-host-death family antitoxin [Paracoccaceae bacterium]